MIVEPSGQDAFTIFAQSMDRTGFAAGTLAVRDRASRVRCPSWIPATMLTMADMGHGGMGHDMRSMTKPPPNSNVDASDNAKPPAADPHASHQMPAQPAQARLIPTPDTRCRPSSRRTRMPDMTCRR